MLQLVALYAIDALEGDERLIVERALRHDVELRSELDAYHGVAAALAEAVETAPSTPSPVVWERIAAEVDGTRAEDVPRLASVSDIRKHRRWTWIAITVSAAAVVVSVALGARVLDLQEGMGETSIEDLATAAIAAPGSRIVTLEAAEGFEGSQATIVLQEDGTGFLLTDTLESIAPDRTYQLWAVVRDGEETRVISAGVLGPDPGVSQFSAAGAVEAFAITEEVSGGVVVSEGATVVVGAVDS